MSEQLYFLRHAFNFRIHSFVLMSNHFHLIARTPDSNLSEAMRWFMTETSRRLTFSSGRINQTYGRRYFHSVLRNERYYLHAYKYVYSNPLVGGLCERVERFPFSTLSGLLGQHHLTIPIEHDDTLFNDVTGTIEWLNQLPQKEDWESVRKAIRRKEFVLGKVGRQSHRLESAAL